MGEYHVCGDEEGVGHGFTGNSVHKSGLTKVKCVEYCELFGSGCCEYRNHGQTCIFKPVAHAYKETQHNRFQGIDVILCSK